MSNQYMDILKNNGIVIQESYIYPIYKKSKHTGIIVKFTSLTNGEVVHPDNRKHISSSGWIKHTDYSLWKDLTEEEYRNHITSKGLLDE